MPRHDSTDRPLDDQQTVRVEFDIEPGPADGSVSQLRLAFADPTSGSRRELVAEFCADHEAAGQGALPVGNRRSLGELARLAAAQGHPAVHVASGTASSAASATVDVRLALTQALHEQARDLSQALLDLVTAEPREDIELVLRIDPAAPAADLPWEGLAGIPIHQDEDTAAWFGDRAYPVCREPFPGGVDGDGAARDTVRRTPELLIRVAIVAGDLEQQQGGAVRDRSTTRAHRSVVEQVRAVQAAVQLIRGLTVDVFTTAPIDVAEAVVVQSLEDLRSQLGTGDESGESHGYHVVCFIGHSDAATAFDQPHGSQPAGLPASGLRLRFEQPSPEAVRGVDLYSFEQLDDDLRRTDTRLLLMDTCWLPPAAGLGLLQAVEHVIGWNGIVTPRATRVFAEALFAALFDPSPATVARAVASARCELREAECAATTTDDRLPPSDWLPVHYARSIDAPALVDPDGGRRAAYDRKIRRECSRLPTVLTKLIGNQRADILQEIYVELEAHAGRRDGEVASALSAPAGPAPLAQWLRRTAFRRGRNGPRFILFGDPGAGKSTVLAHLALQMAGTSWLPVRVRIEDLVRSGQKSLRQYSDARFTDGRRLALDLLTPDRLDHGIATGRLAVLVDGLDETSNPVTALEIIDQISDEVGAAAVVVASRTIHNALPETDAEVHWTHLRVGELRPSEQRRLIEHWLSALKRSPDLHQKYGWLARHEVDDATERLAELIAKPAIGRTATNPLWLTLTAIHFARYGPDTASDGAGDGSLPNTARGLMNRMIKFLFEAEYRGASNAPQAPVAFGVERMVLRAIALYLLESDTERLQLRYEGDEPHPECERMLASWPEPLRSTVYGPAKLGCESGFHWRWTKSEDPNHRTILDLFEQIGIFGPDSPEELSGRFPILPFADHLAAEALHAKFLDPKHADPAAPGLDGLLEWVKARLPREDETSAPGYAERDSIARQAETLALLSGWLDDDEQKHEWLTGLVEIDSRLGLRALALTLKPPAKTIAAVLGKGGSRDKQRFWDGFRSTFEVRQDSDVGRAFDLLETAASMLGGGTDRFFLEEEALALQELGPEVIDESRLSKLVTEIRGGSEPSRRAEPGPEDSANLVSLQHEPSGEDLWRPITPLPVSGFRPGYFGMGDALVETEIPAPFWMLSVPVTVGMYGLFDPEHRQLWRGKWYQGAERTDEDGTIHRLREDRPVTNVSWFAAIAYTRWLNAVLLPEIRAGKLLPELQSKANQGDYRFRLPTEREWEWACRAGTTTKYWCGDELTESVAWCDKSWTKDGVRPVGEGDPNPHFGLRELHGNSWEWCADAWDDEPAGNVVRLSGRGSDRVLRGGAYGDAAERCCSAARFGFHPAWFDDVSGGFRPVFAAPLPSSDRAIEDRS